mmetsp:Transcript_17559/g.57496  ORF Transcript_17559/g.57496 Transcript_17559/m.57496 type:complete len:248 (-) Transcript_17559:1745-2488(-)
MARPRVRIVVHLVHELFAELRRDEAGHLQVVQLGLALDVVLLAEPAVLEHEPHRLGDVARVDVEAGAGTDRALIRVDGDLLAAVDLADAQGDELLRVLPLAKRVHHVHRDERHPVRAEVRVADHLGRRLGGRVRVGRLVRVALLEGLAVLGRAEHLVCRKVDEFLQVGQRARVLEHGEGRLDVVLHKWHGRADRIVDVCLGSDVQDNLDTWRINLVSESWWDGRAEVDAVRLDQVENARVTQPVVPL